MILYREHRATLEDAMKTVRAFKTKKEMIKYIKTTLLYKVIKPKKITTKFYTEKDERIGWFNIRAVLFDGQIIGFTGMDTK